jgi:hypothetical protein
LPLGWLPLGRRWLAAGDMEPELGGGDCCEASGVVLSLCESVGDAGRGEGGEGGEGRDAVWDAMAAAITSVGRYVVDALRARNRVGR